MKKTKFQRWVERETVAEVARKMTTLGDDYACTIGAVYQWLKGEYVPRPAKIRGLVQVSQGALTLRDVHDHIDIATAAWRERQQETAK